MLYKLTIKALLDTSDYPDPNIFDSELSRKKFIEGLFDGSNDWPTEDIHMTLEKIPDEDLLTR